MNPFELALQLIIDANKAGTLKDVKYYFDLAEEIQKEALERRYIEKKFCDKCGTKIQHIEMSGQHRVKCDCKNGKGDNYESAYQDWLND